MRGKTGTQKAPHPQPLGRQLSSIFKQQSQSKMTITARLRAAISAEPHPYDHENVIFGMGRAQSNYCEAPTTWRHTQGQIKRLIRAAGATRINFA